MLVVNMLKKITVVCLVGSLLTGCTNEAGKLNKTNIGVAGGAIGGALLGSTLGKGEGKILAAVAGAALGGLAGGAVGSYMDKADLEAQKRAQESAFEYNRDGAASPWKNPNSGASGSIIPTKTYQSNGQYCREYQQNVTVSGKTQHAYGTACRQPDGSWQIVS